MPSNHLILCNPLLLLPSIFPSIRVFSNELAPCIRCPKYWNFSFSISSLLQWILGISCQNLLSFQRSYITVATICSQLISQQQLPIQKILATRNHHGSCCLLFRNPWVQPVSQHALQLPIAWSREGVLQSSNWLHTPPNPIIYAWRSPFPLFH